jgi:hypothetical protein
MGAGLAVLLAACAGPPGPDVLLSACTDVSDGHARLRCLGPYFERLTLDESAAVAVSKAKELQREGVVSNCHFASHLIGRANLEKQAGDPGAAMATCSRECLSGCYHGVMEAYVARRNTTDIVPEVLSFCQTLPVPALNASKRDPRKDCIHGSGHGLLMLLKDRPSPLVQAAGECAKLASPGTRDFCLGGVFMENVHQHMLLDEDAMAQLVPTLCNPVIAVNDSDLIRRCVSGLADGVITTGYTLAQAIELCNRFPSRNHRDLCIQTARAVNADDREAAEGS